MADRPPAVANYREAGISAVSCATCLFMMDDGECSYWNAPVERNYVCDEWDDVNQTDYVRKASHLTDEDRDDQHPAPKYTATPRDTAMRTDRDRELWNGASEMLEPTMRGVAKGDLKAAGIAVRAQDTGRVLMIQRSNKDTSDPAAGNWEFPGGKMDEGESSSQAAKREWEEEMGMPLPAGEKKDGWQSGVYRAFILDVPSEDSVPINLDQEDRRVMNPDDPDGDDVEVAAWWDPKHLRGMSALRPELRASRPWSKLEKADTKGALYLISHAKTRYNSPGKSRDKVQSWKSIPIDAQGRKEAAQLGKFLSARGVDELHSSDIVRAKQTADIAARHTGLHVRSSSRYRPWNLGDFAGHSSEEVIPKLKPYMTTQADQPVESGGESFNTFKDRFIPALEALLKKADSGRTVALITHSRNIELAQGWLAGNRKRINTRAITTDDIEPASVFQVSDGKINQLEDLSKGQAFPATVRLRVGRMHSHDGGFRSYGMHSREGHFVGRTMPTTKRALKGDTLSVSAAHFSVDPQGMTYWLNPVVEDQSPDAPHSWRQLEALAGAAPTRLRGGPVRLSDDEEPATDLGPSHVDTNNSYSAPGPAGQIPDPGDEYNAQSRITQSLEGIEYDDVPTGRQALPGPQMEPGARRKIRARKDQPGLGQVHVDAPLQNIGVSYAATARKNKLLTLIPEKVSLQIHKADQMKQIVYGVVLEPNVLDTQSDFMRPADVERTAHGYLRKAIRGKSSVSKLQHRTQAFFKNKPGLVPVESFIAPCDFTYEGSSEPVTKGSWVLGLHVEDPQVWEGVMRGDYSGFSVGGSGIRQSMSLPSDVRVDGNQWIGTDPSGWAPRPRYTG